jgi:hypothetical protein
LSVLNLFIDARAAGRAALSGQAHCAPGARIGQSSAGPSVSLSAHRVDMVTTLVLSSWYIQTNIQARIKICIDEVVA